MADKDSVTLDQEWTANVQQWYLQDHLWGGVLLEEKGDYIDVVVVDYMDLERRIRRHFGSYEDALGAVGEAIDDYQLEARAAYMESQKAKH